MERIEVDVKTREIKTITLTPEEEADSVARTAAEAIDPVRLQHIADAQSKAEAKADAIVQYLRDHTPAECANYVQDNVTDLASAKAFLKKVAIVLCALSKESLR